MPNLIVKEYSHTIFSTPLEPLDNLVISTLLSISVKLCATSSSLLHHVRRKSSNPEERRVAETLVNKLNQSHSFMYVPNNVFIWCSNRSLIWGNTRFLFCCSYWDQENIEDYKEITQPPQKRPRIVLKICKIEKLLKLQLCVTI